MAATSDAGIERDLLEQAARGDARSLQELFGRHQGRLKRMVTLRLDPRVQPRIDASDILQEAYLEVSQKLDDYLRDPKLPFHLWLRLVTGQKLALAHRQHLGVKARDAGREISLYRGAYPAASSAAPGGPAHGQADHAQPGGPQGRAASSHSGGAQ